MSHAVRTAVIPAAGFGTRFLPATKAVPKEMLPLVDKPSIQWVVEEAVRAGITNVALVTTRAKATIEDHFDRAPELEATLEAAGKTEQLELIRSIAGLAEVIAVRQGEAAGLGHAVGCGRTVVGDAPFAVMLPDDIIHPSSDLLGQMIALQADTGGAVIALMEVPPERASAYGCVSVAERDGDVVRFDDLVEKPPAGQAPSNLAIMGRYVFPPDLFAAIDRTPPGKGGEIQVTDAIVELARDGRGHGVVLDGGRFDTGDKGDYLRAVVELALEHPTLGEAFADDLVEIVTRRGLIHRSS